MAAAAERPADLMRVEYWVSGLVEKALGGETWTAVEMTATAEDHRG
ncbi:MAG: hypothetical protein ABI579_02785 [Candidatus Sumerlaeota bacterium]